MAKSRRRGAREGSIFERKSDGRWVASLTVNEPGQKRRLLASYHATQAEAIEGLDKLKERRKAGDIESESRRPTLAQHLETWLKHTVESSVRPLTYVSYRQHVRVHLTPALGHVRVDKLSPHQVRAFKTEKLKSGLSPRTVKYSLFILRAALQQAKDDGLVIRNIADAVKPPSYKRPQAEHLDAQQAQQLIRAAEGERLGAAYLVGLSVGLRRGELLALPWSAVDLDGRTLTVNQSLERIAGKLVFVAPKSKTSIRTIALPDELVDALRRHRIRQLQERLARPDWKDSGLVFTTGIGTPIEPRNLTRDFKRILRKAGLPGTLKLHSLRHSTASLLLAQNVHPRVVMELLGHSQISLTLDTYSHVMPSALREAADRMSVALASGK